MGTSTSSSKELFSRADVPPDLDAAIGRLVALDDEPERRALAARCLAHFDPDELLPRLKAEAERFFAIDTHAALRLAEALIVAADLAGRPRHGALGLLARADALRNLGRYQEALDLYEAARRVFRQLGDEVGWARTYTGWVYTAHLLGRGAEALAAAEPAYAVLVRHREWIRAAGLDQNRAIVCQWLGRYDEALRLYDRAQRLFEDLGPAAEDRAARAKTNRAMILTLLGDFPAALTLHEEARQVFLRHGETVSMLRQDLYIADVHASQGDYTRALRRYGDAFRALDRDGHDVDAAWAALSMAECYLRLNRPAEALALAEETVPRFDRCGTPTEGAKARFACALAHARLGDGARALALLDEAARTFARTGLTGQVGLATLLRAGLHLEEEDWPAALEEAGRARALFAEQGLVVRQAQAELVGARALLALDRPEEAAALARSVLAAAGERELSWLAYEGRYILAGIARARGEAGRALDEYRAAMESIERVQSRLALELRTNFLDDKLQVYHDAIACCLDLGRADDAFATLERAKSRALVDYLAAHPAVRVKVRGTADRGLAAELAHLREEHDWFYNRLYGYGLARRPGAGGEAPPDAEIATLQAAIRDRERRIGRILEGLALCQAEGLEGFTATPAGHDRLRPLLDERTVLLEYYLHDGGSAVFVLTREGLAVAPLDARPAALARLLKSWQLNLDATARALASGGALDGLARNARGILQGLHRALIGPVAPALAGRERLIVVPHGPAHGVPFHALHDGERHLIETVEVATCPSGNLLRLCAERPRRVPDSALILAHSDGGRLPLVLEEARAVAALLPGECHLEERATRAALAGAPRHGVLHLAAHGEARLDNPTFAHLKLADGQLGAADVFNLDLDGALVTLSGCETGHGVVVGGDEVIGLSRGFLYAGATTLVQSLWRVEDGATARTMARFYTGLRAGRPPGAALRAAQLAALREEGPHPFLWAPFQLVGVGDACEG